MDFGIAKLIVEGGVVMTVAYFAGVIILRLLDFWMKKDTTASQQATTVTNSIVAVLDTTITKLEEAVKSLTEAVKSMKDIIDPKTGEKLSQLQEDVTTLKGDVHTANEKLDKILARLDGEDMQTPSEVADPLDDTPSA